MSSILNEYTLEGGEGRQLENEQGRTNGEEGDQNSGILSIFLAAKIILLKEIEYNMFIPTRESKAFNYLEFNSI